MSLSVVILAAGKGTRIRSSLPKVLHEVANKPMVGHVINAARQLDAENIYIVYGFGGEVLKATLTENDPSNDLTFIEQKEQLGTGHAVDMASSSIKDSDNILVLYGDVPLTKVSTLQRLLAVKPENGMETIVLQSVLNISIFNFEAYSLILFNLGAIENAASLKNEISPSG